MIRALFICSQNKLRSPAAEQLFTRWPGVETDSAGLNHDAEIPLSTDQIDWASIIFVMEKAHRNKLIHGFQNTEGCRSRTCHRNIKYSRCYRN